MCINWMGRVNRLPWKWFRLEWTYFPNELASVAGNCWRHFRETCSALVHIIQSKNRFVTHLCSSCSLLLLFYERNEAREKCTYISHQCLYSIQMAKDFFRKFRKFIADGVLHSTVSAVIFFSAISIMTCRDTSDWNFETYPGRQSV